MSKIAYISCPMTVSQAVLDQAHKKVSEAHVGSISWTKGTHYDDEKYKEIIQKCDVFIVILSGLAWRSEFDQMTSGSRKELLTAFNASRPIYLFYKSREEYGIYGIYAVDIQTRDLPGGSKVPISICGIASTKYNFKQIFDTPYTSQEESKAIDNMYAGADFDIALNRDNVAINENYTNYQREKLTKLAKAYQGRIPEQDKQPGVVEYKPDNRILLFF